MKILTKDEIHKSCQMDMLIQEFERFYEANREVKVPERIHIDDNENTVLIMPSFDKDYYAIKLVGVAPNNQKLGKPSIHGQLLLHDRATLEPLAMLDGQTITALRTGAIGGLSMKYLANPNATSIGIVGTGIQGWSHLQAACSVRDIQTVFVNNRSDDRLKHFVERVHENYPHIEVKSVHIHELVERSQIIITTTTSPNPVLPEGEKELWKGKHIVAVGSFKPSMQELPNTLLQHAKPIFIDTHTALTESGDMIKAKKIQGELLQTITLEQLVKIQPNITEFSLFKSVGMALFDLIAARFIHERCL